MPSKDEKTIMIVEVSSGILRHIRSSGMYANLAGHQVDYIAFMSHQGTYVGEVKSMRKRVPLNEIYPDSESSSRTTLYYMAQLLKHPLRRNSKLPRGRKRITAYERFLEARVTSELFHNRRD